MLTSLWLSSSVSSTKVLLLSLSLCFSIALFLSLFFFLPPLCPLFFLTPILICAYGSVCASHPTPAIIECPEEVHAPTPPTMVQNGDKAPSAKPHIYSVPVRERFFFLSLKGCLWCLLPGNNSFVTSCFEVINHLASFLLCFWRECLSTDSGTLDTKKLEICNSLSEMEL